MVLAKVDMVGMMENVFEKLKEIKAVALSPIDADRPSTTTLDQQKDESKPHHELLPPPPAEWMEELRTISDLEKTILSQANEVDLLHAELDKKNHETSSLQRLLHQASSVNNAPNEVNLQEDLQKLRQACKLKDLQISEYMFKETEWDLHAAKTGNELQYYGEEVYSLQGNVEKLSTSVQGLQAENLQLKQELLRW